jgi:hypothetical protein
MPDQLLMKLLFKGMVTIRLLLLFKGMVTIRLLLLHGLQ